MNILKSFASIDVMGRFTSWWVENIVTIIDRKGNKQPFQVLCKVDECNLKYANVFDESYFGVCLETNEKYEKTFKEKFPRELYLMFPENAEGLEKLDNLINCLSKLRDKRLGR